MTDSSDQHRMWAMYREACMEEGAIKTHEGFMKFVAWRKRVEKYFDNKVDMNAILGEDSS